ncbi:MAG: hypothetical protein MZV49_14800 [Rhodopseudomonas palustris]|nr:hypothetical protein [Rhodopseudomonas palustris]
MLDGHTANPGDLDWSPLAAACGDTVHDRTPAALTLERAAGAQVLLTNKVAAGRGRSWPLCRICAISACWPPRLQRCRHGSRPGARHRGDQRSGL